MKPAEPRPPALSRRLLERAERRLATAGLAEDAAELFREKARLHGGRSARGWYRRQARSATKRILLSGWLAARRRASRPKGYSLDAKLGIRMLARYPGLTVVCGLALAFAIFVGAATFEILSQFLDPRLPFPESDRIVGLRYWNRATNKETLPVAADLRTWRDQLGTVADLGGFRDVHRNLAVGGSDGAPVRVAEMSAAGFRLTGTSAAMGRALTEADDEPGAAAVAVIGHRLWLRRFGADPDIVGRTIRLDGVQTTVVGVMPESFAFPRDHDLWTPLVMADVDTQETVAAPMRVFGMLTPGATLAEANAETGALAAISAREDPGRYEYLTAEVLPYAESLFSLRFGSLFRGLMYQLNLFPTLLLVLVCGNIALLMFARAASRTQEVVVRRALGASRGRIISQLFVEALVLGALATALGLAATGPAIRWVLAALAEAGASFPFWIEAGVSSTTVIYTLLLTLLGAAVAGVVPGMKITSRQTQARLHEASAGAGGLRLGGIWTAVIVTQITATVVFTGVAWTVAHQAVRNGTVEPHFPADRYLGARIELDLTGSAQAATGPAEDVRERYLTELRDLRQRIAEDPAVSGVALADRLPVQARGFARIETDLGGAAPPDADAPNLRARSDVVDLDFFEVFSLPPVAGRGFDTRDLAEGANTLVVNTSFVEEILEGRSAVGTRVRYPDRSRPGEVGPQYEIVGVVRDLVGDQMRSMSFQDPPKARIYHPLDPSAGDRSLYLIVHAPGGAQAFAPTLYGLAADAGPELKLRELTSLDRVDDEIALLWRLFAFLVSVVSGLALFLSLAGIYAVMSFTVAKRTREIGIRVALGARTPHVVAEIFRKPAAQVGAGIVSGCALMGVLVWNFTDGGLSLTNGALLLALGAAVLCVCALACVVPTRRASGVQPAEALGAKE